MSEHASEWIPAYHDGELHGARRKSVAAHLQACPACQAELDELRALSGLLQAYSVPEPQISADRFAAQVMLRANRPAPRPGWESVLRAGWQASPLAIIAGWAFSQAVLWIAALVLVAGSGGYLNLAPTPAVKVWTGPLSLASSLLMDLALEYLPWMGLGADLLQLLIFNLVLTAGTALLLWGWLASWWLRNQSGLRPQSAAQPAQTK